MQSKDKLEIVYWVTSVLILLISAFAIYYGPIRAVKIGRKLDDEYDKVETKRELFLTLFAFRGSPIHYEFVNALNQIEIVFQGDKKVLDAWRKYFDALHDKNRINQIEIWNLHRTDLLSAMAISLGYSSLTQTDIMKYYYPEGHANQMNDNYEFREAQRQFYLSGAHLYGILIAQNSENKQEDHQS